MNYENHPQNQQIQLKNSATYVNTKLKGSIIKAIVDSGAESTLISNALAILEQYIAATTMPGQVLSSMNLRLIIAKYPPNLIDHQYTDGTQQYAFFFWLDLINICHDNLKNLFKYSEISTITCSFCSHATITRRSVNHINLSPNPNQSKTPLYTMFQNINIAICDKCDQNVQHTSTRAYLPNLESRYLIIYVNNFHYINGQGRRIESTISEFKINNFVIPSHNQTQICRFKVKTAIVRLGETIDQGHYITWTRSYTDHKWIKITDNFIYNFSKYTNSQKMYNFIFSKDFEVAKTQFYLYSI